MDGLPRSSSPLVLAQALLDPNEAATSDGHQQRQHQQSSPDDGNPDGSNTNSNKKREDLMLLSTTVPAAAAAATTTDCIREQHSDGGRDLNANSSHSYAYDYFIDEPETAMVEEGCSSLGKRRGASVKVVLQQLAAGNTIHARGEGWKLTRAVVHLEDAWKGRVSPCPPLEADRARKLFKLRWRYRGLDFLIVHMFLVLSVLEIPAWCEQSRACFWSCYPDFTRNWHMEKWLSLSLEGCMLTVLVAIGLLDVRVCGRDYWAGTKGVNYQAMWFKHGVLALYATIFLLAMTIDYRAHGLCGYCRVLLYLSVHRRTMLVVAQLRHILGAVAEIWLLIFLNIVLFAWVGLVLFSGTEEGSAAFPDMFEASWRLFVLFTTTNFPDIMISALDTVRATIIYFAGFVMLNVFFLAPLSLAFIFNVFRGGQTGIPNMEEEIRLNSSASAFALLDDRGTGQVSIANMGAFLLEVHDMRGMACREIARLQDLIYEAGVRRPEEPSLDLTDFTDGVRVMDRSLNHAEWITEIQWYYPRLYESAPFKVLTKVVKYERVTVWPGFAGTPPVVVLLMDFVDACLLVISFITLFVATSYEIQDGIVRYDWVQMGIVVGFCITTTLCAVVRGWHNCLQRPTWVFNAVITFPSLVVMLMAFTEPGKEWGWRVMRALRVIHLSLGIAFVPRLGFLVRTLLIMTRRAATPASVLLAWAVLMAVLGTQIFGGTVCDPALSTGDETCEGATVVSNLYTTNNMTLLNFNDVPTSLVTLFVLFVVNDWYVIVDEFVDVTETGWARLFFIVNYIMGVAVILNLVVTVVINSFWDEYKNTNKPALALRQLHDAAAASAHHASAQRSGGGGGGAGGGRSEGGDDAGGAIGEDDPTDVPSCGLFGRCLPAGSCGERRWGWERFPVDEEDEPACAGARAGGAGGARVAEQEPPPAATGAAAGGGVAGRGSSAQQLQLHLRHVVHAMPQQPPQQRVMPEGDQEGMEAERAIARRASRRRLNVSGIT